MKFKLVVTALIFVVMSRYACAEGGKGFVTGRVLLPSGKPMKNALVLFYVRQNGPPPFPERYWRVPDIEAPVGPEGKFSVELIEGEYYVGAIGRESSKIVPEPPAEGDILMLVKDKHGQPKVVTISEGKTINVGNQKGFIYHKSGLKNNNLTTIEGTISGTDGTPAPNLFVFAFQSPERGRRPLFVSDRTNKSGKYVLKVDGVGPFYLRVRDTYGGGRPQSNQLMGAFGGDEPAPVSAITDNKLKGIDITVQPVQRPDGM